MRGEGCDEDEQGVVSAEMTGEGSAKLRITLLAAGFVIGESTKGRRAFTRGSPHHVASSIVVSKVKAHPPAPPFPGRYHSCKTPVPQVAIKHLLSPNPYRQGPLERQCVRLRIAPAPPSAAGTRT